MPGKISKSLGIKTGDVAYNTVTDEPFYRYGRVNRPVFYRDGEAFVEIIYPRAEMETFPLANVRTVKYEGRWEKLREVHRGRFTQWEWLPFPTLRKMRKRYRSYMEYCEARNRISSNN